MADSKDFPDVARRLELAARSYCAVLDAAGDLSKTDLLLQIYRILPDLIGEAIRLPDINPWDEKGPDDGSDELSSHASALPEMTHEEWANLYESLKRKLGNSDLYWQVFNPLKDQKAIPGSLSNDIADIYRDLRNGLIQADSKTVAASEIAWEWQLLFYAHWGRHAMEALRAIHELVANRSAAGEIA